MKRLLLACAAMLLLALPASAEWTYTPDGTNPAPDISGSCNLLRDSVCFHNTTDGTDAPWISTRGCSWVDVIFDSHTGATEPGGATAEVFICSGDTASTNHCDGVENDTTGILTGDCATDACAIYGVSAYAIFVEVTPDAAEPARVQLKCNR